MLVLQKPRSHLLPLLLPVPFFLCASRAQLSAFGSLCAWKNLRMPIDTAAEGGLAVRSHSRPGSPALNDYHIVGRAVRIGQLINILGLFAD